MTFATQILQYANKPSVLSWWFGFFVFFLLWSVSTHNSVSAGVFGMMQSKKVIIFVNIIQANVTMSQYLCVLKGPHPTCHCIFICV